VESEFNYAFSTVFISLALWSAQLRIRNKKINNTFVATIIATALAFCTLSLDPPLIDQIIYGNKVEQLSVDRSSSVTAYFSPKQGSTNHIVGMIEMAEKSICVAAYSFTSEPIAKALIAAHHRGVDVKIVLDKSQRTAKYSSYFMLKELDVPTRINANYAIMHNKFLIIDDNVLQTGSFNYTKAAELNNAENVIILSNSKVIKQYMQQWQKLWDEAS
jgi:phosphatidylserine/phosphatidylglycerophosphate/cardiolipin synthase-like enzyme